MQLNFRSVVVVDVMAMSKLYPTEQCVHIVKCELCDTQDDVNWFCKNCIKNLCNTCKKAHSKIPSLSNHEVGTIGDGRRVNRDEKLLCEAHGELLQYRCLTCSESNVCNICVKCIADQHRSHETVDLEKEAQAKRNKFERYLKQKGHEVKSSQWEREENEKRLKTYDSETDNTILQINKRFDEIKQMKEKMIEKIEKRRTSDHVRVSDNNSVLLARELELQEKIDMYSTTITCQSNALLDEFTRQARTDIESVSFPDNDVSFSTYKVLVESELATESQIFGRLRPPREHINLFSSALRNYSRIFKKYEKNINVVQKTNPFLKTFRKINSLAYIHNIY